jgi:Transposase DDE domain
VIARRKTEHGSGLGRARWVVERTFAHLHRFKRLLVRFDYRAEIHDTLLAIACCLVCFRTLETRLIDEFVDSSCECCRPDAVV